MNSGNDTYTPCYSERSVSFMAGRTVATHGAFFLPYLDPGLDLLDLGCGPGSITIGLAQRVTPGRVTAVDADATQVELAAAALRGIGVTDARALVAGADALPLDDESVDRVFSHALLEHVPNPIAVLRETHRVLRPGGVIGVCSPDWSGFLLAPFPDEVDEAIRLYTARQRANGGNPEVGHDLGELLDQAGFSDVHVDARYERYPDSTHIADYLADQLDGRGHAEHATALREWGRGPRVMFAQAWVSAVGRK